MKGRITKWFDDKGYGFINGEDGRSYFMHISQVMSSSEIHRNMLVDFTPGENNKGLSALNIKLGEQRSYNRIIKIGDYRFVLSNIKAYGIKYWPIYFKFVRYLKYSQLSVWEEIGGLFGISDVEDDGSIKEYEQVGILGDLYWGDDADLKKNVPYLWIETYQGETHSFFDYGCLEKEKDKYDIFDASYDIQRILDEIDRAKN